MRLAGRISEAPAVGRGQERITTRKGYHMKTKGLVCRAYTVAEVSEISGIPKQTLYGQVREGRCPELRPVRCGTRTVFPKAHIDRLFGVEAA
nr:MAG TPA: helix-turn-helix domain protein [Caudoviricetes sp.]